MSTLHNPGGAILMDEAQRYVQLERQPRSLVINDAGDGTVTLVADAVWLASMTDDDDMLALGRVLTSYAAFVTDKPVQL